MMTGVIRSLHTTKIERMLKTLAKACKINIMIATCLLTDVVSKLSKTLQMHWPSLSGKVTPFVYNGSYMHSHNPGCLPCQVIFVLRQSTYVYLNFSVYLAFYSVNYLWQYIPKRNEFQSQSRSFSVRPIAFMLVSQTLLICTGSLTASDCSFLKISPPAPPAPALGFQSSLQRPTCWAPPFQLQYTSDFSHCGSSMTFIRDVLLLLPCLRILQ